MSEPRSMLEKTPVRWNVIRVGNLIYEQHERKGPLIFHKMFGDPTIILIKGEKNILVDPGYGPYRELSSSVSEQNLQERILEFYLRLAKVELSDIDIVFVTHRHMDHFNLVGMFEKAGAEVKFGGREGEQIIQGVNIMRTPGHDPDHCCLRFVSSETGLNSGWGEVGPSVVIAGDAIVNLDYFKELAPYWVNQYSTAEIKQTRETMRRISKEADIIVPGHGQPFLNLPELHAKWPP